MHAETKSDLLRFAQELPVGELPRLLGDIEEVRATAQARLNSGAAVLPSGPDRLMTVGEAKDRLGVSADYLYRNNGRLPFTVRMGRKLLFSEAGIERYLRQQSSVTARRQYAKI